MIMAKDYDILNHDDFEKFCERIRRYIVQRKIEGAKFKKMKFTIKSWRKSKTPPQQKFYWVVVSEMQKAFYELGNEFHKEEIHEFLKKEHGYTKTLVLKNGKTIKVTKSIADNSEDVNIKVMMDLIDFAIRWCAINLNYVINDPRK